MYYPISDVSARVLENSLAQANFDPSLTEAFREVCECVIWHETAKKPDWDYLTVKYVPDAGCDADQPEVFPNRPDTTDEYTNMAVALVALYEEGRPVWILDYFTDKVIDVLTLDKVEYWVSYGYNEST